MLVNQLQDCIYNALNGLKKLYPEAGGWNVFRVSVVTIYEEESMQVVDILLRCGVNSQNWCPYDDISMRIIPKWNKAEIIVNYKSVDSFKLEGCNEKHQ